MKTLKEWETGKYGAFSEYVKPFDEIDDELYWDRLDVVPPVYTQRGFYISEPYGTCYKYNTATYAHFADYNGRHYFLGIISPLAYSEAVAELKSRI
ncbi:MAG: hypothetical protein ACRDA8_00600 [Shewanella sp.]